MNILKMKINNYLKLIISVVVPLVAGGIGSFFTTPNIETWYAELVRPSFSPPNWIFAPVWTLLFILMGVALWLVWSSYEKSKDEKTRKNIKIAIFLFGVQIILNVFWSIIFFGTQNPGLAFAEIIILWLAILATIIAFVKVSRWAGWLLLPYILWVSFAAYLNYAIWMLN